jgi:molybdopterin/thiamine biosynthesis adenylyltransferase
LTELASGEFYSRQVLFRGIGEEGQKKLRDSRVAIVGCGATGSVIASLLTRSGVGNLRIVDRDYVELSNLQRQTLFSEADAAEFLPKAVAAAKRLSQCNSSVEIEAQVADLTPDNVDLLLGDRSLIMDGTDNFETRYLINDFAILKKIPWIYAAAIASVGVTMNILPGETACLACMFPDSPRGALETCETSGILNAAVAGVGAIATAEALKILTGARDLVRRTLLTEDVWWTDRAEIPAEEPRADCMCCVQHEFRHLTGEGRPHITLCGRNSVQIHEQRRTIDLGELENRLLQHGAVRRNDFALRFWREPYELTLFPDGRAIIKGTTDVAIARSFYARFVGA